MPPAERERYTGNVLHSMCPDCPKCFVVAPSVPDGGSEPLAERERYTGTHSAQGCPDCPKCFVVAPSVSDGGSECLPQSESATPERVSRMS